jgi:hypothetical protein
LDRGVGKGYRLRAPVGRYGVWLGKEDRETQERRRGLKSAERPQLLAYWGMGGSKMEVEDFKVNWWWS